MDTPPFDRRSAFADAGDGVRTRPPFVPGPTVLLAAMTAATTFLLGQYRMTPLWTSHPEPVPAQIGGAGAGGRTVPGRLRPPVDCVENLQRVLKRRGCDPASTPKRMVEREGRAQQQAK